MPDQDLTDLGALDNFGALALIPLELLLANPYPTGC